MACEPSCKDCLDLLTEFLEGTLSPEDQKELERHFAACPPCLDFLRSYREAPRICREATAVSAPPEVRERLRRFLSDRKKRT